MTDDEIFQLSRRKALAGIGTIGLASAGAGLGTSAFFSDTESFDGNTLTAGELDLKIGYYVYKNQGSYGTYSVSGTENGSGEVNAELSDVKPGDSGLTVFCPEIHTNPAYLWFCGELISNDENSVTEPEAGDDPNNDTVDPHADIDGEGELAQSIQLTVSYCDVAEDIGDSFDRDDVSHPTEVWTGTLADFLAKISSGVPIDGKGEEPSDGGFFSPGHQSELAGSGQDTSMNPCICLDWEIPGDSVHNEIQSDSLEFDLEFHAMQARHNDGTKNPCSSVQKVDGEGWGKLEIEDFGSSEMVGKVRSEVGGGADVFAGRGFSGGSTTISAAEGTVPNDANDFKDFTYTYDGSGEVTLTYNGTTVSYDESDLGDPDDKIEMTLRGEATGAKTRVKDVTFASSSVSKSLPDFESPDGGKSYCGLTGIPDLDGGFTLSGKVAISWGSTQSSPELASLNIHVDTE